MADSTERTALNGSEQCETLIIGAGFAGLTTALELAREGHSVVVLEAQKVGFGASGRNGGFVNPGFATGQDKIAATVGPAAASTLYRLSVEGMDFVRETINSVGITSADPRSGMISVQRYEDAAALRAEVAKTKRDFSYDLEYMSRDEVQAVLKSDRYYQAIHDPKAFHIHPLNYARGLAQEIERLGGRIYENSAAVSMDVSGAEKSVRTSQGVVRAKNLVITTGGYTGPLNRKLQRSYLPIATYVMVSEVAPDLISEAITTPAAIGDSRRAGDYYRLIEGGRRILWGGRITTRAASTEGLVCELRHEMTSTYPQLSELRTELAWSGLMSYARHLMPQIGQMPDGVWYCTAFGGHGLNTTAIGGKLVAEAILKTSARYKIFEPFGLPWAGGYAGLAVAQLTYWKLQAQDWWRERSA
jgi:glycine/D-amino acid oxidase-like deaminating enzyme